MKKIEIASGVGILNNDKIENYFKICFSIRHLSISCP